ADELAELLAVQETEQLVQDRDRTVGDPHRLFSAGSGVAFGEELELVTDDPFDRLEVRARVPRREPVRRVDAGSLEAAPGLDDTSIVDADGALAAGALDFDEARGRELCDLRGGDRCFHVRQLDAALCAAVGSDARPHALDESAL